jgi:hypothetical protein
MYEKINGQSQNKWVSEVNWLWLWKWSQSMIKIDSKKYYEREFEKVKDLGPGFWFENMKMFAQYLYQVLKVMCEKV